MKRKFIWFDDSVFTKGCRKPFWDFSVVEREIDDQDLIWIHRGYGEWSCTDSGESMMRILLRKIFMSVVIREALSGIPILRTRNWRLQNSAFSFS